MKYEKESTGLECFMLYSMTPIQTSDEISLMWLSHPLFLLFHGTQCFIHFGRSVATYCSRRAIKRSQTYCYLLICICDSDTFPNYLPWNEINLPMRTNCGYSHVSMYHFFLLFLFPFPFVSSPFVATVNALYVVSSIEQFINSVKCSWNHRLATIYWLASIHRAIHVHIRNEIFTNAFLIIPFSSV